MQPAALTAATWHWQPESAAVPHCQWQRHQTLAVRAAAMGVGQSEPKGPPVTPNPPSAAQRRSGSATMPVLSLTRHWQWQGHYEAGHLSKRVASHHVVTGIPVSVAHLPRREARTAVQIAGCVDRAGTDSCDGDDDGLVNPRARQCASSVPSQPVSSHQPLSGRSGGAGCLGLRRTDNTAAGFRLDRSIADSGREALPMGGRPPVLSSPFPFPCPSPLRCNAPRLASHHLICSVKIAHL